MKIKIVLFLLSLFCLLSCNSDDDSSTNNDITAPVSDIPTTGSYIRASVDGGAFTTKVSGNENVFVLKSSTGIQITGNNSNMTKAVSIYLDGITQTGTYTIDSSSDSTLNYTDSGIYYDVPGCAGASGTVTITFIDNSKVEGTFQFIGKDTDNCSGPSKTVTSGSFRGVY